MDTWSDGAFSTEPPDALRVARARRWKTVTVMERFDLRAGSSAATHAAVPAAWTVAAPEAPAWDANVVVPRRPGSFDGLLALGALSGSALAVGAGYLLGWTGTSATIAALVGLDVGVLVGAGAGTVLARHHRRLDASAD